jgi:hypothetical protein
MGTPRGEGHQRHLKAGPQPGDRTALRWAVVSLSRRWRGPARGTAHLGIERRPFTLQMGERLTAREGDADRADCTVVGSEAAWRGCFLGGEREALAINGEAAVFDALQAGIS